MTIFKCPQCNGNLSDFRPSICQCGYQVPVVGGVYQFTDDKPISVGDSELQWLGYEKVGENYEPGYVWSKNDDFGMFGSCARKLAEIIGKDKIVLDLGAGLGQASIPLAMAGVRTVAVDISQAMMSIAAKRAEKHNVPDDVLCCARMNAYDLRLADHSIDAIIEIDMLHQVNHPELVMEEIKRVLKKDGVLIKYDCSKGFPYSDEHNLENAKYNDALKDIQSFYDNQIINSVKQPFSSWDQASDCIKREFDEPEKYESGEKICATWNLRMGLHKTKTRANGSRQLMPDDIHNEVWRKTEEYAAQKYGEDFYDFKRSFHMIGVVDIYRLRKITIRVSE